MATTGFWPVKGKLKDVIEYAQNPDKTTNPKYLDSDLLKSLAYVKNNDKTDQQLFVSGINCTVKRAYERMISTKKRFGKMGGNVAYHAFQSFKSGEVTPEEAHAIGMETARHMWGSEYEIVVTTHLNSDNLHNHMVVNSVSFKTGRKFENHISDHYKLRDISDWICAERGKSVLENSIFYGGEKGDYWVHKNGGLTHRDILKRDVASVLEYSRTMEDFKQRLKALGYQFIQSDDKYHHFSVKASDWKRPIRLSSLGYTKYIINSRLQEHQEDTRFYLVEYKHPQYSPKSYPLYELERKLDFEINHSHDTAVILVDVVFYILLLLLMLAKDENAVEQRRQPLSPSIRLELANLDQIQKEYLLLADNHIHSAEELSSFIEGISGQVQKMEQERQHYRNQIRRCESPDIEMELKQKCKHLSEQMKPLREKFHTAGKIVERYPKLQKLLETEHQMESDARNRERERERGR